ncbi:MAG: UDP-N-acetylmuramoyl-tripeptide--D-alanyl-D-alanine ligase [Oscillospiraceae bacterium]|nr:UDP-N-acetylmuramoyl-tripeptide--D-alanyl-D-alanine ligase [Oscillospiraceae bacterium]
MISLQQAAAWCGGQVLPEYAEVAFFGSHVDSRKIGPGELFIAIPGERDGHGYIPAAMAAGAAAALGQRQLPGVPMIVVPDSVKAWEQIAARWRESLKGLRIIGLTGSVGKTTTKEMCALACGAARRTQRTLYNYNNERGVAKTLLDFRPETELGVVEMGMNHAGEISRLSTMARPNVAVITGIGKAHIGNLGSQENICRAKLEILDGLAPDGVAVLNGDDPLLRAAAPACRTLWFGLGPDNDLRAEEIRDTGTGVAFTAAGFGRRVRVELPVPGKHYVMDALAALLAAHCVDVELETAAKGLQQFENTGNRLKISEARGCTLIADCYNAGVESMAAAFEVLRDRATAGRRIAVLGDMLELGSYAPTAHRLVGAQAAAAADLVLAFGEESRALTAAAGEKGRHFETREALLEALCEAARPGDTILFKASHGMRLEEVLKAFTS